MRRFTINNLTVNLGDVEAERQEVGGCPLHSCGWTIILDPPCSRTIVACGGCTLRISDCGPITSCGLTACHPAITNTQILNSYDADDLGLLRAELQRELQGVEASLADLVPPPEPRTVEEIEELERQFGEALTELQRRKSELGSSD
ncbi:hypothetical protein [Streptomyces sp. NPDC093544]|uniref:hypothetical protein n=1 Tax=Streptomyces sp. NPDC093544 TaxID=3155200 RepID=UPI0034205D56